MSIFDVVVDNDQITVLGPPSSLDVAIDIGQQGIRGSKVFAGSGNPNSYSFGSTELIDGDLFLNTSTGSTYGWLYRYTPKPSGDQWDSTLRLQTPLYAGTSSVIFTSGQGTVSIPTSSIIPADMTIPNDDNFIIQITPISNDILIYGIDPDAKGVVGSNFVFTINARKYNTSATGYSNLLQLASSTYNFNIQITVV